MKKEFDTFVYNLEELPEGEECRIAIRDLSPGQRKYKTLYVKAVVSSSPEKLPAGDTLWIRTELGRQYQQPWKIKIIEQLEELEEI